MRIENKINMIQIIEQSYEEKMRMYMKHTKRELVQMLIESNKHLDRTTGNNKPPVVSLRDAVEELLDKEIGTGYYTMDQIRNAVRTITKQSSVKQKHPTGADGNE